MMNSECHDISTSSEATGAEGHGRRTTDQQLKSPLNILQLNHERGGDAMTARMFCLEAAIHLKCVTAH